MLALSNLTVEVGGRAVVRDISFRVHAGTLLWITGENGAGKSSVLRVLAQRGAARGAVAFDQVPKLTEIAYYSPVMGPPVNTTVRGWLQLNHALLEEKQAALSSDDRLLPRVAADSRLTRLSTGETKRLLLWSLLRMPRPFTFLDEPYEHLSPAAKARLTEILSMRAAESAVVVATNQEVPSIANKQVLEIDVI